MPTLFSRFNGKGGLKAPSGSRYGQGISSTDLSPGSEDATHLTEVPSLRLVASSVNDHDANVDSSPAWRTHHIAGGSLTEFGVVPPTTAAASSQRTNKGNQTHSGIGLRKKSFKATSQSLSSTKGASAASSSTILTPPTPPSYGYTTVGWDIQIEVSRAVEIVLACGEQIRARGLDSPLIFSSMALDLSSHNITSLLQSYINSPTLFFSSDVKFANAHDLAAVIKWTLARVGRIVSVPVPAQDRSGRGETKGEEIVLIHQRGFLDWEVYHRWAAMEKANAYPASAFSSFLDNLSSSSLALLVALFSLLSSTACYNSKNGMAPSRLSRLFGPLIFGLPEDETFEKTYEAFVKAGNATEHLLLSYIRDNGTVETLPTRLADHIQGYPAMLSVDITKSSRSVQGVPVTHVNRTVRLYSLDLLQTACEMDVESQSAEWKACCASDDVFGKDPQLADRFCKLINLKENKKQGRTKMSSPKPMTGIESYGSLTDKRWGDFLNEGFAAPDQTKLNFDLRESERKARNHNKKESVQWSQFEESGFVLADEGLASVLDFDDGLREDMQRWPAERAELMDKLQKAAKKIPDFPFDTTPYIVSSPSLDSNSKGQWDARPVSRFDEVFAEVFADVLLGNGWSNRDEQTHRNSNFAVVQYKSRSTASTVSSQASNRVRKDSQEADDRTDAAWFVVEEIVPSKYRNDLEESGKTKNRSRPSLRKLNLFKKKKEEGGLGGAGGGGSHSRFFSAEKPSSDDVYTTGPGGSTKKMHLHRDLAPTQLERQASSSTIRQSQAVADDGDEVPSSGGGAGGGGGGGSRLLATLSTLTTSRTKSMMGKRRGKEEADVPPPVLPPKDGGAPEAKPFGSEDYETRSLHDAELDEFKQKEMRKGGLLHSNKASSQDDSWLDIMIRANGSRMGEQDAVKKNDRREVSGVNEAGGQEEHQRDDRTPTREMPAPAFPKENVSPASLDLEKVIERKPSPSHLVKRKDIPPAIEGSMTSVLPSDSLQQAGWTRDDVAFNPTNESGLPTQNEGEGLSIMSPLQGRLHSPPVPGKETREGEEVEGEDEEEEEEGTSSTEAPTRLAYLKPLPPQSSSAFDIDNREKAREVRIQAAKERARSLRASLNPVVLQELEARRESLEGKPLPTPLSTLVKSNYSAQSSSPKAPSSPSMSSSAGKKDDPFSKDRVSGRVANVASKFGGGGGAPIKSLTPQSTGNSVYPGGLVSDGFGGLISESDAPRSSTFKTSEGKRHYPPVLPAETSTLDPNRPARPVSLESNNPLGTDSDSIYPDDAASNFSHETQPEEFYTPHKAATSTSLRQASTLATLDSGMSSDTARLEEDDHLRVVHPIARVPYQPGMPLSNLEEESESVLSGSNNARV
ncbi:hypothetical protein CBS101457_003118 [Exobasidium rhododendri]|nr:hypothetical protein CBS101457_003118 [Exobasidium rhododendri]